MSPLYAPVVTLPWPVPRPSAQGRPPGVGSARRYRTWKLHGAPGTPQGGQSREKAGDLGSGVLFLLGLKAGPRVLFAHPLLVNLNHVSISVKHGKRNSMWPKIVK